MPLLLVAALFTPLCTLAATAPQLAHVDSAFTETDSAAPGLDEHLGAKLPLDAVFRDEQGRQVRLGSWVESPIGWPSYRCRR